MLDIPNREKNNTYTKDWWIKLVTQKLCVCVCVYIYMYDSHVFGPLKDAISGVNFSNDEEVKNAVLLWLRTEPKNILLSIGVTKSL
jgi:hypothetical protein